MQRDVTLAVVVAVVDGRNPQVPATMRTTATLLGVSAGAATADQLARVAMSAVSEGREITGILWRIQTRMTRRRAVCRSWYDGNKVACRHVRPA